MVGRRDAELVFPGHWEGGGGPIAVADEGVFGEDIEDALLLARAEGGLVYCCGRGGAGCGEEGSGGIGGLGVACVCVLLLDGGFFGLSEVGECGVDVGPEVLESADGWGAERDAFVGHVTGQNPQALYRLASQLLTGSLLDK